ncbi:MAG: DUF4287 domain-containing protein [Thermoanaerobaculia bacterium]|nr:DUF4287 domain-containing protein [Thermoanaerobaculia bacterium]
MAPTPDEMAAKMIANLPEKTGKRLEDWLEIVRSSGLEKHGQMVKFLKTEHGMTHGFANLVAHKAREAEEPREVDLVAAQYEKKAELRPIYDELTRRVLAFGDDVDLSPKKSYVSLRRSKQFGLIQPSTKTRVDVGIQLRGEDPTDRLEIAGSSIGMVSHRVRVTSVDQVDDELIGWLRQAYESA